MEQNKDTFLNYYLFQSHFFFYPEKTDYLFVFRFFPGKIHSNNIRE